MQADSEHDRAWLEALNDEQRAAATATDPTLLILAGAGTGKTTTLSARVAWLITEGASAERILLLTFTRRAAREMLQRAEAMVERSRPRGGQAIGGTFHSVAHRMVRMHAASLGLDENFGVLDAGDAADLLDMLREEHGGSQTARRFPRAATLLDVYSRTVNAQQPLDETIAGQFPWVADHREVLAAIFRDYGARKRKLGVIDLDDLLLYWRALMLDEVIAPHIAHGFDHVLVDEYQDVNAIQVDIVRALREHGPTLTAVGDDMQAIYGFRAASAAHILGFRERFPDAAVLSLERNYRSSEPILAVANAVSRQEHRVRPRTLWTDRDGGPRPELAAPRDEAAQAHAVCDRVLAAREEGMLLQEQAVLFRTGHDADLLELELTRRDIPFVKYGGLKFLDAAHVKDLLALLRVAVNPRDEMSWFRLLQLLDGVGPVRARRILDALSGESRAQALARVPESAREQAGSIFAALGEVDPQGAAGACVEQLVAAIAPAVRLRYPDGAVRAEDLQRLAVAASGAADLRTFISELVLDPPSSSADLAVPPYRDEDFLVLSTVHSAKGLEWDAVHLICAYDGNFPADMNTSDEEGIAEERRLFYVALTRARRRLHVYVPERFHHRARGRDDAHGLGQASRFITPEVRGLMDETQSVDPTWGGPLGSAVRARRIDVTVDSLFA